MGGVTPPYSFDAERELMSRIREGCGAEIDKVTGGDRKRSALLAAITANESEGRRQAYRFVPELHDQLVALLAGRETKVHGITKAALEKFLAQAETDGERAELLKRLAGMHGYTQIPGYYCVIWKLPIDALTEKERHFELVQRRLDEISKEHELPPETDPVELGRFWSALQPNGKGRSLFLWRLQTRIQIYLDTAPSWEPDRSQGA